MRLQDKVAVITGAGAGLGRASALLFAENGASIVVVDIVEERASAVAAEIKAAGGRAIARPADASVESEISAAVNSAVETFGKLDVLYNNAGIGDWGYGSIPVEDTELDHWRRVIDVNLTAAFLSTKYAIPHMRANGGGSIVITSSVAGEIAMRYFPAYCASKAGVDMYAKTLALEVGQWNIRVNCVAPMDGMGINFWLPPEAKVQDKTMTELMAEQNGGWKAADWPHPLKSPRAPSFRDNAYAALYLASDESMWTSGTVLSTTHGGLLHASPLQASPERTANSGLDGTSATVGDMAKGLAEKAGLLPQSVES